MNIVESSLLTLMFLSIFLCESLLKTAMFSLSVCFYLETWWKMKPNPQLCTQAWLLMSPRKKLTNMQVKHWGGFKSHYVGFSSPRQFVLKQRVPVWAINKINNCFYFVLQQLHIPMTGESCPWYKWCLVVLCIWIRSLSKWRVDCNDIAPIIYFTSLAY